MRKRLFAIHGWLGLNFGLWLFLVCSSGALASLAPEIEWLTEPELRIDPRGPVRWQATYDALRVAYPDYQISSLARGEETVLHTQAWTAFLATPDQRFGVVRVDPYAARIVQPFTTLYLSRYVEQLHYYLYSPKGFIGFYIVTALAFPLLFALVSALLFQKGWWKYLFVLRVGSQRRWSWSSAHRFIGLWSLLFGVIIGVTGAWYLVEEAVVPVEIAYPDHPQVPDARMAEHGATPRVRSLDEYVDAARRVFPELQPQAIDLPFTGNGTVAVKGPAGNPLVRDRANAVFMDPVDGTVIEVRRSRDGTWLAWWVDAADPLHFGYLGGLFTKLLWCLLGLCLPALVLTGAYLSLRRARRLDGSVESDRPLMHWRQSPIRSAVTVAVAFGAMWSCVDAYRAMSRLPVPASESTGMFAVGPWRAALTRMLTATDGTTNFSLRFDAGPDRIANVRKATLWSPTTNPAPVEPLMEFGGHPQLMTASFHGSQGLEGLVLRVEDWSGRVHVASLGRSPATADTQTLNDGAGENSGGANVVALSISFAAVGFVVVLGWLGLLPARPFRQGVDVS